MARSRLATGALRSSNLTLGNGTNPVTGKKTNGTNPKKDPKKQSAADKIAAEFGKRAPNFGLHNQATSIQGQQQPSETFLKNVRTAAETPYKLQQGQAISKGIEGIGKLLAQLDNSDSKKASDKADGDNNGGKGGCTSCQQQATSQEIEIESDDTNE